MLSGVEVPHTFPMVCVSSVLTTRLDLMLEVCGPVSRFHLDGLPGVQEVLLSIVPTTIVYKGQVHFHLALPEVNVFLLVWKTKVRMGREQLAGASFGDSSSCAEEEGWAGSPGPCWSHPCISSFSNCALSTLR